MITALAVSLLLLGQGGLKSTDVKVGKGRAAKSGDILTMIYRGTLADGKVFDENQTKAPFVFKLGVGQVIKGWDQGLVGIKVGGRRTLVIPAALGYGDRAIGPIPANSVLTFEVQALRIDAPEYKPAIDIVEIKKGSGAEAKSGDKVMVHYNGMFLNGAVFDSSTNKEPLAVSLGEGGVIKGFEEGILGMKVGGRRKVTIPYQLAYGESGRPPVIPRMTTLVFEIQLVSVK